MADQNEMAFLADLAWDWGVRAFGRQHMVDTRVRALRMLEEAIELGQACSLDKETVHLLVDKVFERPVGDPAQELGGVMLTLAVLERLIAFPSPYPIYGMRTTGLDYYLRKEVRRCLSKPPEHFAKRNQEKLDLGLR